MNDNNIEPDLRPTPLTDSSEQRMDDIPTKKALSYFVPADFARTLERSLAERTEERDSKIADIQIAADRIDELKKRSEHWCDIHTVAASQRDTALAKLDAEIVGANNLLKQCDELRAKLAKCREALEEIIEPCMDLKRDTENWIPFHNALAFARQTLEETK